MTISTKRENVERVRDRLRDPASSNAWNAEAADMLDELLDERDAARAEAARLRDAWLRVIQAENTCAVTGQPCREARRCGCAAEQEMLIQEASP